MDKIIEQIGEILITNSLYIVIVIALGGLLLALTSI